MTFADQYRSLAAQFMARARSEQNPTLHSEWDFLAVCYMRLADQAERNGQTDVFYEPPLQIVTSIDRAEFRAIR